jgi:hypothetical protein
MLNFIWRFDDRNKPIFATALVTPKILLISKVFKSDLKKGISLPYTKVRSRSQTS